jgi:hypothetical protein
MKYEYLNAIYLVDLFVFEFSTKLTSYSPKTHLPESVKIKFSLFNQVSQSI